MTQRGGSSRGRRRDLAGCLCLGLLAGGGEPGAPATAAAAYRLEVARHGITWTFAKPTPCGRFANGDWWVVGPVDVVAILPGSEQLHGRTRNGSMLDPSPRSHAQGYDSALSADGACGRFDAALDVGSNVSPARPLRLRPGTSLVSTVSHPAPGQLPQLDRCAVLTCLDTVPPANAFRPPYTGRDKRCRWSADDLDLTRLARLDPVPGAPSVPELVARLEATWLDHLPGRAGRFLHPRENMPEYGRDLADLVGTAALVLQLDLPRDEKRQLLIALVQIGIDSYGIVKQGGSFVADGGEGSGRKFPLLLAGVLLDDDELVRAARDGERTFGEDAQTFYVTETAPGVWNHGHGGYGPEDSGMPEWGNRHALDPSRDRKSWSEDPYRRCCTANTWAGFVLAARVMGLQPAWGHDALFDYVDRYMQIEGRGQWTRCWNPFVERMWDRYRSEL